MAATSVARKRRGGKRRKLSPERRTGIAIEIVDDPNDPGLGIRRARLTDAGTVFSDTATEYDPAGRDIASTRTLPESQQERFEYNDPGQRTLHVSFEGRVTEFEYDNSPGASGRLAERRFFEDEAAYDEGNGTPSQTGSYTYDAFGRIVETIDSEHGTWTTAYDADGRIIEEGSLQADLSPHFSAFGG